MMRTITYEQWRAEGHARFGPDTAKWAFVCPACGHVQTVAECTAANMERGAIGFSCIGRWAGAKREAFDEGEGPCNYAGGGLFPLNPVAVKVVAGDFTGSEPREMTVSVFEWAPAQVAA